MPIPGNLLTTAMAVMPHQNVDRAIELALTLDIPFWPQLPRLNYYEDMYVQASEHFPGILLDLDQKTLRFSIDRFIVELEDTLAHFEEPEYFDISPTYSAVYHRFLNMDHSNRPAIRGQLEGPISFGFNVMDQDDRPILFNDTVRPFMFEFMARRVNVQLNRLKLLNTNAFMFIDEPGLQFLFSALSGYNDSAAKTDVEAFLSMIDRPRVLVWGIVPTNVEPFSKESLDSLEIQLETRWAALQKKGIDRDFLLSRSLLSPATCCLVNPDGEKTVEKAFEMITSLSARLREKYRLI